MSDLKSTLTLNYSTYEAANNPDDLETDSTRCLTRFAQKNQGFITSLILFSLAFLNIADRYIVGSVLQDVQTFFGVSKPTAGLLQTIFLLSYMSFSPLNGYLGDRINRKYLLITSIILWITSTVGGSFVGSQHFYIFVLSRCLFGIATASFETIAVPIIGDRFADDASSRFRALLVFNMGPPIGTGLAYLIGLIAKDLKPNDWRFSMRFSPILLAVILVIIVVFYIEPKRGNRPNHDSNSRFIDDVKILIKNKTYLLLLFSWTAGLASLGAFSWWSSTMIDYSLTYKNIPLDEKNDLKKIYSLLQVISGVIGLYIPCELSRRLKNRMLPTIDCYLLAAGFFISSVFIYIYLVTISYNVYLSILVYMVIVASFNMGWVIQAQILLDITTPNLRSTANAMIIFVLHLIGDSVSPYWMGLIADGCISAANENTIFNLLKCTQLSFYPLVYVSFISAVLALFSSLTFSRDKENTQFEIN